eukprot:3697156-Rhodomonas_salina.4
MKTLRYFPVSIRSAISLCARYSISSTDRIILGPTALLYLRGCRKAILGGCVRLTNDGTRVISTAPTMVFGASPEWFSGHNWMATKGYLPFYCWRLAFAYDDDDVDDDDDDDDDVAGHHRGHAQVPPALLRPHLLLRRPSRCLICPPRNSRHHSLHTAMLSPYFRSTYHQRICILKPVLRRGYGAVQGHPQRSRTSLCWPGTALVFVFPEFRPPQVNSAIRLRACYAMPSTDLMYAPTAAAILPYRRPRTPTGLLRYLPTPLLRDARY